MVEEHPLQDLVDARLDEGLDEVRRERGQARPKFPTRQHRLNRSKKATTGPRFVARFLECPKVIALFMHS